MILIYHKTRNRQRKLVLKDLFPLIFWRIVKASLLLTAGH